MHRKETYAYRTTKDVAYKNEEIKYSCKNNNTILFIE